MAQWGNTDDAANSVFWAAAQLKNKANTANQTALFGNTTADAFITNATVGQFGVGVQEAQANGDIPHSGWVLRTTGSGGRAGRVHHEVLVAGGYTFTADASDDATYPDYVVLITGQPEGASANTDAAEEATFTVTAVSQPTGATLTYAWSYANGDAIQAGANVGNTTQTTLTVNTGVETANVSYKVVVATAGGQNATSSNATLTVTTA
jgi:hypothetical protein